MQMELSTILLRLTDTVDRIDRLAVVLELARDMENYEPDRLPQYECLADAQLHYCLTLLDTYNHGLTEALEDLRSLLTQAKEVTPQLAVAKNSSGSKRCVGNGKPIE
jgi:hypothetical protein